MYVIGTYFMSATSVSVCQKQGGKVPELEVYIVQSLSLQLYDLIVMLIMCYGNTENRH